VTKKKLAPVHPGEVLLEEFLVPLGLSQNAHARFFGTSPEVWLGLQMDFELDLESDRLRGLG